MCLEDIKGFSQPWKSSILARNVSIVNLLNLSFQDKFDLIPIFKCFIRLSHISMCVRRPGGGGILKFLSIPCRTKEPLFMVGSWWRAEGNTEKRLGEIRERGLEKYGKEVWRYKGKGLGKCGKEEIRVKSLEKYVKESWRNTGLGRVKGITKEENRGNVST